MDIWQHSGEGAEGAQIWHPFLIRTIPNPADQSNRCKWSLIRQHHRISQPPTPNLSNKEDKIQKKKKPLEFRP